MYVLKYACTFFVTFFQKMESKSQPLERGLDRSDPSPKAGMWQKWWCLSSKAWHEEPLQFLLWNGLLQGKSVALLWGHSSSPCSKAVWRGTQVSYQQAAPTCQVWMSHLWNVSPSSSRVFGWLQPWLTLNCNPWKRRLAKAPKVENKIIWQVLRSGSKGLDLCCPIW